MKMKLCQILGIVMLCFTFTACQKQSEDSSFSSDYIAKEGRCVVSIPKEYDLVYEDSNQEQDSTLDIDLIHAETIEGKPKNDELKYLSVLLHEPFRIMTPLTVIQNKNNENKTLTGWKMNGIHYQDADRYVSKNVYTCIENTIIEPVYSDFKTVGIFLYLIDEEQNPKNDLFDENGHIIEQEDVFYFYGPYDFNANKDTWKTNMDLANFAISLTTQSDASNGNKDIYHISIRFDLTKMLEKGEVAVKSLCEIVDHGYMIHPSAVTQIISGTDMSMEGTFYVPIQEHTLQCTFTINM